MCVVREGEREKKSNLNRKSFLLLNSLHLYVLVCKQNCVCQRVKLCAWLHVCINAWAWVQFNSYLVVKNAFIVSCCCFLKTAIFFILFFLSFMLIYLDIIFVVLVIVVVVLCKNSVLLFKNLSTANLVFIMTVIRVKQYVKVCNVPWQKLFH